MSSLLSRLVTFADDMPGCGTKWPGWRPHPPKGGIWQIGGPSPDPWNDGGIASLPARAALFQALRLAQLSNKLGQLRAGKELASGVSGFASLMFDDYCGTVPIEVLIWWLLHNPPPPPPPWLQDIISAVGNIELGERIGDALGSAIQKAGIGQLEQSLGAARG